MPVRVLPALRIAVAALVFGALLPLSPQAGGAADAPKITLKESFTSRVAAFWPAYVAQAQGFYAKEGLRVEDIVADPNASVPALLGGSVDIAVADSTNLIMADDKGASLVAVGMGTDRFPYKLMAVGSIKTIAQLKGKRIGAASPVDVYTTVIKDILRKGGLDPEKDVDFVFGGSQNQRFSAIMGGAIQAGLFSAPADSKLARSGYTTLAFTPDYVPNLTLSVVSVRRDWARTHADALRRFLRAQAEAVRWLDTPANKSRAVEILAQATNSSIDDATAAYDYYITREHVFPSDACVRRPGLESVVKILQQQGRLTKLTPSDVPQFTDTEYCPK